MSDDDFETRLRARLADLADGQDDWTDPLPEARRRAAAGATDDAGEILEPVAPRRRWLPGLAIAATVAALLVGGGFGVRELVRSGGSDARNASAGAAMDAPADGPSAAAAATGDTGSSESGSCASLGPARSSGSLATNGTVRIAGIVGPRVVSGGSTDLPVVLSFGAAGPSITVKPPQVRFATGGELTGGTGGLGSDLAQGLDVKPGVADSGSVTFHAVDCEGNPLPAGSYLVAVVYTYSVTGGAAAGGQLVSGPVRVVVS